MTNPAHTDKEKIVFPSKSEVKSADNFKTAYVFYKYDNIRKLYTFISPAIENLTGYTIDELNKIGFENIIRDTIVDGTNCYPVDKKSLRKIK
ncbi:MAG: hypothetical protein KJO59_05035, partial [Ignavibacteria bacterium]|nr:hypothetical protein [Ignavibacteria bacterium]